MTAASAALAGCGDDDAETSQTRTEPARTAPNEPAASDEPAEPAGSLAEAETRLEAAGYTVEEDDASPPATAARLVDDVLLFEYSNVGDAKQETASIKQVFRDNPGRGVVTVKGRRVYFLGQERNLTGEEREEFRKVVDVAEGRG